MPKKTPENCSVRNSENNNMFFSPNQAAMSTKISIVVLFKLRSYSETEIAKNFLAFILTQYHTLPKEHIQKSNIILNDIVSYGFLNNGVK